jgi:hypothetical protein
VALSGVSFAEARIPAFTLTGVSEPAETTDDAVSEGLAASGAGAVPAGDLHSGSATATIPTAVADVAIPEFGSSGFEGLSAFVTGRPSDCGRTSFESATASLLPSRIAGLGSICSRFVSTTEATAAVLAACFVTGPTCEEPDRPICWLGAAEPVGTGIELSGAAAGSRTTGPPLSPGLDATACVDCAVPPSPTFRGVSASASSAGWIATFGCSAGGLCDSGDLSRTAKVSGCGDLLPPLANSAASGASKAANRPSPAVVWRDAVAADGAIATSGAPLLLTVGMRPEASGSQRIPAGAQCRGRSGAVAFLAAPI